MSVAMRREKMIAVMVPDRNLPWRIVTSGIVLTTRSCPSWSLQEPIEARLHGEILVLLLGAHTFEQILAFSGITCILGVNFTDLVLAPSST